jgi:hypothetical protein
MIAEAIEMHLELMQQSGENPPAPSSTVEFSVGDDSVEELCTWVEVESPQHTTVS